MATPFSEDKSAGQNSGIFASPDTILECLLEAPSKSAQYQEECPDLREVRNKLNHCKRSKTIDMMMTLEEEKPTVMYNNLVCRRLVRNVMRVESIEDHELVGIADFHSGQKMTLPEITEVPESPKTETKNSVSSSQDASLEVGRPVSRAEEQVFFQGIKMHGRVNGRQTLHSRTDFRRYIAVGKGEAVWKSRLKMLKSSIKNAISFLDVSKYALKKIENSFGSAVASYFVLLKHLVWMNLFLVILQTAFVIAPQLAVEKPSDYSLATASQTVAACTANTTNTELDCILQEFVVGLFTGEGWYTDTPVFIGHYTPDHINPIAGTTSFGYHMPSGYLYTYLALLLVITIFLARWVGDSLLLTLSGLKLEPGLKFAGVIFSSWDFNITKGSSARQKLKANLINLTELHREHLERKDTRTIKFRLLLYLWRVFTWLLTILLLLSGCFLIVISPLCNLLNVINDQCAATESYRTILSPVIVLIVQAVLDFLFPLITKLEFYHKQSVQVFVSLIRIVLVRIFTISAISIDLLAVYILSTDAASCWETQYGQEFYRQTLFAFLASIFVFPIYLAIRRLVSKLVLSELETWNWIPKKILKVLYFIIDGPTFNIATRVMNIIYIQTLLWFGLFFSPFMSIMGFLGFTLLFIVMSIATLSFMKFNVSQIYYSAKSSLYYNFILIIMFSFTFLLLIWPIFTFQPSSSCSPFRNSVTIYSIFTNQLNALASLTKVTIPLGGNNNTNPIQWLVADYINSPLALPLFSIMTIIIAGLSRTLTKKKSEILHLNKRVYEETTDKLYFLSVARRLGDKFMLNQR